MPFEYLYGHQPVHVALRRGGRRIRQLLFYDNGKTSQKSQEILAAARHRSVPIQYSTKSQLDALCQQRPHQNVALQVDPLCLPTVDGPEGLGKVAMLLVDIGDPQNLGAIIRSASYFGLPRLYLTDGCSHASPTVSKASAGSLEFYHHQMRICRRAGAFIDAAKQDGWLVLGTSPTLEDGLGEVLHDDRPKLVVMGSEGEGLKQSILDRCDRMVTIRGSLEAARMGLDSLNVSVAAALLLQRFLDCSEGKV